jgi:hypothetical protein
MRCSTLFLPIAMLLLAGCEKSFDKKYQDELEQLNAEADEIQAGISQQLAEGAEADTILAPREDAEHPANDPSEAAP